MDQLLPMSNIANNCTVLANNLVLVFDFFCHFFSSTLEMCFVLPLFLCLCSVHSFFVIASFTLFIVKPRFHTTTLQHIHLPAVNVSGEIDEAKATFTIKFLWGVTR